MIYTAIIGNLDKPRSDVKCFSGYNQFKDPVRNAKIYKVLSHYFDKDEYSIWIDGNIFLKKDISFYINLLGDYDIAVFRNFYRNCLYEEAKACIKQKLDDPEIIEAQIKRYKQKGFPENAGLPSTGLIIRRQTDKIKYLNEKWWAEICRGSRRDQISFPYIFHKVVRYLPMVSPFNNEYFKRIKHHRNYILK